MQLETVRGEIERMRAQVSRQRKEILQLQRAGIATASAEGLLQRMLDRIDALCLERDRLKQETPRSEGKVLRGLRRSPLVGTDLDLNRSRIKGRKIDL
jgi:hypothetical protein